MKPKHVPIFVINLNGHIDRLERMSRRLDRLGLDFERVPAVDGRTSFPANRPRLRTGDRETARSMSHVKALRLVVERELPRAIILEDDAAFDEGFAHWASSKSALPANANIVTLEGDSADATDGALPLPDGETAYLITLDGAKKALKTLDAAGVEAERDPTVH